MSELTLEDREALVIFADVFGVNEGTVSEGPDAFLLALWERVRGILGDGPNEYMDWIKDALSQVIPGAAPLAETRFLNLEVVEEFTELDKMFESGLHLVAVKNGYGRKLIEAISRKDWVFEREALKGLGDVYLEEAKMNRNKLDNFNKACAFYNELLRWCQSQEEREVALHRIKYAEKCTKLVHSQMCKKETQIAEPTFFASVSLFIVEVIVEKMKGKGGMDLVGGYTGSFVRAVIVGNKRLQAESLKSLGDLYFEKGRNGKDHTTLSKAHGLYGGALKRCDDSDGRETLKHRMRYTEKFQRKLEKEHKELDEAGKATHDDNLESLATASHQTDSDIAGHDQRERGGMNAEQGNCIEESISTKRQEEINILETNSTYNRHLQEGCRALQEGDLDQAEQSFAAALKSVHVKELNTDENWKEAEPLHKLSDVYLKRGMQSKDGGDFTKAAALCHAALARSAKLKKVDKEGIKHTILEITKSFLKGVLNIGQAVDIDDAEKHKSMLTEDRDFVEKEMKRIELEVDPYSLEKDDPKLRETEKARVKAIQALFQTIAQQRKMFITSLVDECIEAMGPPPCKYAMVGLGSQATGLVTPYSDVEFAILIEKETDNNIEYFRNLTHYLHLKVINLGETILPAMAIQSLNDFHSDDPLDDWYYDSVTPHGFSFDGAMPKACKTPLGRGKACELIRTPAKMTEVLTKDITTYLKEGYHLATVLGNVCLITGEQDLVDEYTALWSQALQGNDGKVSLLKATMEENATKFSMQVPSDQLLNVKKEIYRFSSLAVYCLALFHDIQLTTIWDTVEQLHRHGVVDSENAHHLMVMVSISAELRLRTYMNNRGQVENMSALSSMATDADFEETLRVFYFSNRKQLMRYYYTAKPFQDFIAQLGNSQPPKEMPNLFDNSFKMRAKIFKNLCAYKESKDCMVLALDEILSGTDVAHAADDEINDTAPEVANLMNTLGIAFQDLGDHRKAAVYFEGSLNLDRKLSELLGWSSEGSKRLIATGLHNLALAVMDLREYAKAVNYLEESLEMRQSVYGTIAHHDIALSLHNLGIAWAKLGDYRKAISYFEQALQMRESIYQTKEHPSITRSYDRLGSTYRKLGDHRQAINYHEKSLKMKRIIYGQATVHPDIAESIDSLGHVCSDLGDHRKAISYYQLALQMERRIYGEDAAHPAMANLLNNLGYAWVALGDHREALSYFEQSLQMWRSFHGETTVHHDLVVALDNLGTMWRKLGDDSKACGYFVESMRMKRSIYGETFGNQLASAFMKFFKM
ncbi:PREDICTED: uncharacterized protein LOC109476499 [Branchiostoma belcheri]|uniref:Uncharacterized protein LOC109476499 n=1 Tax=Branchiostoma belcheri TaxID=7741 RepID=A0A6P4YUA2_BRABE|nr:PREDICTED: uncharacterized protein LOC109476499 [Branchiostoma belcheri]XP_019632996.1 PREDICTED: uncharacterized protein LOC109476499 [Branchiostoma belcheri]XP_019632997.1 PREDICTED: uncharacterized protein LOC109476499 [Branchiostoma belcheri]